MIAVLNAPYMRGYLNNAASFIGFNLLSRTVGPAEIGGFFAAPITLPQNALFQRTSHVFLTVQPLTTPPEQTSTMRIVFAWTRSRTDGSIDQGSFNYDWPAPWPFLNSTTQRFFLDNGSGYTFPANYFRRDDTIGMRFWRDGTHANDTWTPSAKFAENVELQIDLDEF